MSPSDPRTDLTALARRYVALSNAHDTATIGEMLTGKASYASTAVGRHEGRAAILAMMTAFFAAYSDVTWRVAGYDIDRTGSVDGTGSVVFDFVMTATPADGGAAIERRGRERIDFTASGAIRHIEVVTA